MPDEAIEQYSKDECFVDFTTVCRDFNNAEKLARDFKDFIKNKKISHAQWAYAITRPTQKWLPSFISRTGSL